MKKKKTLPLDALMAIIIMLFAGALAIDGFIRQDLPADAVKYPIFVFCVIAIVGLSQVFSSLKASKGDDYKPAKIFENKKNFIVVFGMIVSYIIVMYLLGFILSSIIFAIAVAAYFKYKHLIGFSIGAAIVFTGVYYVFVKLLYIFLPSGLLFDKLF